MTALHTTTHHTTDVKHERPALAPVKDPEHRRAEELLGLAAVTPDDEEAERLRQEAVILTLDLADSCARRYRGRGAEIDDLVQVARMALVKAVQGYRPERGRAIEAYAIATISGELKKHFRDHCWTVRPPRRIQEQRAAVASEQERLWHELHRDPSPAELASALEFDVAEVEDALLCATAYRSDSLDATTARGGTLADTLACPRDDCEVVETRLHLRSLLAELPPRDKQLIHLRFVEELTQSQIGERIGLSQMQVSRLLTSVLARLREGLVAEPISA